MPLLLRILILLRSAGDLLTPESTLRMDIRFGGGSGPRDTVAEVNAAFNELEQRHLAVAIRDDLTNSIRWKITDAGRAALAERNL